MWRRAESAAACRQAVVRLAAIHAGDAVVRHDHREKRERRPQQARGAVDHGAHGRVGRPDHVIARDERPEPVREVDDVGRRHAGKQILRAAGESDDLVGKHRPADEDVIVVDEQPVERDRNVLLQPASRQLRNLVRGNLPELHERLRIVPPVVENPPLPGKPIDNGLPDVATELLVGHRRVGAERHQIVQRGHARPELVLDDLIQQGHRHRPGAIRNQDEQPLAVHRQLREPGTRHRGDVLAGQIPFSDTPPDYGISSRIVFEMHWFERYSLAIKEVKAEGLDFLDGKLPTSNSQLPKESRLEPSG